MAAYITLDSAAKAKDALCVDKRCLKVVTLMALGLRRLMEKAVSVHNRTNSIPWTNNVCSKTRQGRQKRVSTDPSTDSTERETSGAGIKYMFECVNGISLNQILPAPSTQKQLLNNMILSMTSEEFKAKSVDTVEDMFRRSNDDDGQGVSATRGTYIRADEVQGVFQFHS